MLSKAEVKRRKQQSARDRARHRAEQVRLFWTVLTPPSPPLTLEETVKPVVELMGPAIETTKVSKP